MSQAPGTFDDFLSEISASLSGNSGEAALRRINAERVLKLVLDDIVERRHDVQIRVLDDNRIAGDSGADILVQIDSFEIRLEILDAPENNVSMNQQQIERFIGIFKGNPSTDKLIITWTTPGLNSIELSLDDLVNRTDKSDQIKDFIGRTRPLAELLKEILITRIKVWEDLLTVPQEKGKSITDIRKLFAGHFHTCLGDERNRSYKLDERKAAAALLSEKDAAVLFNGVLDQALDGESVDVLAKRLSHLPKRSGK